MVVDGDKVRRHQLAVGNWQLATKPVHRRDAECAELLPEKFLSFVFFSVFPAPLR